LQANPVGPLNFKEEVRKIVKVDGLCEFVLGLSERCAKVVKVVYANDFAKAICASDFYFLKACTHN